MPTKEDITIIWLKRDLRLNDHAPFIKALNETTKIFVLFIFEPMMEASPDFSLRHWQFIYNSIKDLRQNIPVHIFYQTAEQVFNELSDQYNIKNIYSHQETGIDITFKRDLFLKSYFKKKAISWKEFQNNGVIRGLKDRKSWDYRWVQYMKSKVIKTTINKDQFIKNDLYYNNLPEDLLEKIANNQIKDAGAKQAQLKLAVFINEKIENYFSNISYPDKSRYHCSRLSNNISWGNISIREIYQACEDARPKVNNKFSIDQFMSRLKWHCHFIQKFEMEPDIEFYNLNPVFNSIRKKKNKTYIKAWENGQTGYPLIDAAMRCVQKTGYLNFRLRSMVISFLTHHLWQPWQGGVNYLARQFIDYEPGIHFSQFQMQAGTTGINTIRIYNPVKGSLEKDKNADFIKKWVPELSHLPLEYIHQPWLMTPMDQMLYKFNLGQDYPSPIIDHEKQAELARKNLWELKKSSETRLYNRDILKKHTRNRPRRERKK